MYQLSVQQEFVAQHYLTVPDCGPENKKHSHIYILEILLSGGTLNEHGYLVDIDVVKDFIADIMAKYRDNTLNDVPEFEGLNPSIEHFSRLVAQNMVQSLRQSTVSSLTIRIWEDRNCWASYKIDL